ncbi:ABC transporter permease [Mesorhizobium australicum]|uniref:Putative thiamine transport system permease protein n=1 Tax=Mesorhizobium australicum TaxID=536018 RepID=A0A1X7NAS0_9HYPH|nr:ABC transporter permease subunit [Mesorhizobium australicum]SMH34184.1 putative thiamine transport system permease protein [Mesorhizobium australicum]
MLTRLGPPLAILLLTGPILAGLLGTLLPAFGYLPALGGEAMSLEPLRQLAAEPAIVRSALLSLGTGLAATALSVLVVALFLAGWTGTKTFARVQHLISPLLSLPHAAAAFGLAFLIAPSGMIARLLSPGLTGWEQPPDLLIVNDPLGLSLVAGLAVKEIPFLFLVALAALQQASPAPRAALVASLGYGRVAGFLFSTWPAVYRQIRLAVFAVLAFSTSVVDVSAILGPTSPATLGVRIVGWMSDPDLSMRFKASAGAVLQLGLTALALLIWIAVERAAAAVRDRLCEQGCRARRDGAVRYAGLGAMSLSGFVVMAGLATLGIWSVAGLWQFPDALPGEWTLSTWMKVLPRAGGPLATTLIVAAIATAVAVWVTILCLIREDRTGRAAGRGALAIVYLPLIVPQAAFLFGLQLLFLLAGLNASLPSLVLAHLVFVMPYVFLSLSDPWRAYDRRFDAVAAGLGKSRLRTLVSVRLPILARPTLVAAAVGFAVSIGQYLPTLLVAGGRLPTITTEAVALASGGNRRVIGVYAFLQMLLPVIGFAIATLVPALLWRRFRALRY